MIKKILVYLVIFILVVQVPCFVMAVEKPQTDAPHYVPSEWPKEPEYIDRAFGKMVFGLWNFFLGPFEIIKQPYESAVLGDNTFIGFGRGVVYAVCDVAGGFLNFLTFPITALKIPLPKGGADSREF